MAGSMRGADDIHEWNNAQAELRRSEVRPDDMEVEVFPILKFSYTRLNDWVLQQCFLFCALFPEDHKIRREELIDFLIAEGIMKRQTSRDMDFDKGHAMLNKLVKVSLLEDVEKYGERCIMMHDLIRDMAIQIMKQSCTSIVEAGWQLEQAPEEKYWTDYIVWVSLMKNHITEIPYFSPMCRILSTLLLSQNTNLKSIPASFFLHFSGLKVLDLSETGVETLPKSVGCLRNLVALLLKRCTALCYIPSLGKLTSLEMLDLSFCWKLSNIPEGLELLSKLTFLNLSGTGVSNLQSGMLTRLPHLQFLAFRCACPRNSGAILEVEIEELAALQKLESLCWRFHDFTTFNEYLHLVSRMQRGWKITNYFFFVGQGFRLNMEDRPSKRELCLNQCTIDTEFYIHKDLQKLVMENVTLRYRSGLLLKTVSSETELIILWIVYNKGMKYLFHLSSSPSVLGILETLILRSLPDLCVLFGEEVEESPIVIPSVPCATTFCRLRVILISGCNNMKSFCSRSLFSNFHNLTKIRIAQCLEMEAIIAATEDEKSCGHNHFNLMETSPFNLSKLTSFELAELPKLKRICSEQIVCDSLREVIVRDCNELQKIPISLPMISVRKLKSMAGRMVEFS